MQIGSNALIVSVRPHGENGAIVRAMTAQFGLLAGYVRGGRSRQMRPILQPGNLVLGQWRARSEIQLASLTVELVHSRAPLMAEPLAVRAIDWVTAVTAAALPEGEPHPRIFIALEGVLLAIENAVAAREWVPALARFENVLLDDLGYGDAANDDPQFRVKDDHFTADLLTGWRANALDARARLVAGLMSADIV
jgi:DNA repair protein RecO (recombination protein O)